MNHARLINAGDFASDCPVSLVQLAQVTRADPDTLPPLLDALPERTRAELAVWLYGRSHTHELGVRVATTCEGASLRRASGRVGNALYELSRRPYTAPDYGSPRTSNSRRISLGGSYGASA